MTGRAEDSFLSEDASRICNNFPVNRFSLGRAWPMFVRKTRALLNTHIQQRPLGRHAPPTIISRRPGLTSGRSVRLAATDCFISGGKVEYQRFLLSAVAGISAKSFQIENTLPPRRGEATIHYFE